MLVSHKHDQFEKSLISAHALEINLLIQDDSLVFTIMRERERNK